LAIYVRAAALKAQLSVNVDCSSLVFSHFDALLQVSDEYKREKLAEDAVNTSSRFSFESDIAS
jgi:hypothetical protein